MRNMEMVIPYPHVDINRIVRGIPLLAISNHVVFNNIIKVVISGGVGTILPGSGYYIIYTNDPSTVPNMDNRVIIFTDRLMPEINNEQNVLAIERDVSSDEIAQIVSDELEHHVITTIEKYAQYKSTDLNIFIYSDSS